MVRKLGGFPIASCEKTFSESPQGYESTLRAARTADILFYVSFLPSRRRDCGTLGGHLREPDNLGAVSVR